MQLTPDKSKTYMVDRVLENLRHFSSSDPTSPEVAPGLTPSILRVNYEIIAANQPGNQFSLLNSYTLQRNYKIG